VVFSSHIFLHYFLPTVLLVYFALPWVLQKIPKFEKGHIMHWQNAWLLVVSLVFFGWWSWRYVPLMLCVTGVNYLAGAWIAKPIASQKSRRIALVIAVITSLANLAVFKYFGFFQTNLNAVLANLEFPEFTLWEFVLPLGISFYTFQAITYTVDVYRGDARPAESLIDFFATSRFFPNWWLVRSSGIRRLPNNLKIAVTPRIYSRPGSSCLFLDSRRKCFWPTLGAGLPIWPLAQIP
jgi:alginate O-acetyltransferase complex protein AlgI